jgi:dTDP-4-amino-4,6-dideoxygalactose transaminase
LKVPYFIPWITKEDKNSVNQALNQRWLTNGPILQRFENKFSKYENSKFSSGVSSATHGLHLALRALNIQPGDEVIVPTMTFSATIDVVRYCGAKPILTDVEYDSLNISPKEIKEKITKKTKAIIPVHYGGQSCDMDTILSISKKHGLKILEDCAHALGSTFKQKKCGNIGDIGCFSFYPTKIITTGEGGMVVTNSQKLHKKINQLRSHGMSYLPQDREKSAIWNYDITDLGYNYRLDEIRAALGISQFQRLKKINELRIKIAKKYDSELQKIKGIIIPKKLKNRNHIFHLYTIKITKDSPITRNELFVLLNKKGIGTSVQYPPLHLMSFNKKEYRKSKFPNANKLKDEIISLPIFPTMTNKDVNFVISTIKKIVLN